MSPARPMRRVSPKAGRVQQVCVSGRPAGVGGRGCHLLRPTLPVPPRPSPSLPFPPSSLRPARPGPVSCFQRVQVAVPEARWVGSLRRPGRWRGARGRGRGRCPPGGRPDDRAPARCGRPEACQRAGEERGQSRLSPVSVSLSLSLSLGTALALPGFPFWGARVWGGHGLVSGL